MSALLVQAAGRHGILIFVDEREGVRLLLGTSESVAKDTALVVVPRPRQVVEKEEYWPIMLAEANRAFDTEGFGLIVVTDALPAYQLTFEIETFVERAAAYASEGYGEIGIKPEDVDAWGVLVIPARL